MYKVVKYNPEIHHRRSIRLKDYDYSRPGMYFITICVQGRDCLFGEIVDAKMNLNDPGKMVEKWYFELENKFPDIKCRAMIVMPNHFHCIIENTGTNANPVVNDVSDDVSNDVPDNDPDDVANGRPHDDPVGADLRVCPENDNKINAQTHWGEHVGSPLQRVVQWFKTMTTNEYIRGVKNLGWKPFNGKLWQRNYYERIIRNNQSYHTVTDYIKNNPAKWNNDNK